MRIICLLIASLGLFVGACSSKGGGKTHAPPPLDKDLLMGKWKRESSVLFLAGYEFAADGTVKISFLGMKQPIKGHYTWSGDRAVNVEYPQDEGVRKDYEAAAKAYKEDVKKKLETKEYSERAGPTLLRSVAEKLPEKERLGVGISDPKYLILVREDSSNMTFQKEN